MSLNFSALSSVHCYSQLLIFWMHLSHILEQFDLKELIDFGIEVEGKRGTVVVTIIKF